jgi:tight adherence protein B
LAEILKLSCITFVFIVTALIVYRNYDRVVFWFKQNSIGNRDWIVERMSSIFIDISPQKSLLIMIGASLGLGLIVFFLVAPNWGLAAILGIFTAFLGWKLPKPIVNMMIKRRINKFNFQMLDGLSLMSNALRSGLSIAQTVELVANEMPDPISQEFKYILNQTKVGATLEEAFQKLAIRMPCDDVEMFVTSINILRETGGNLSETFDNIAHTIRERIKLESKIQAMTMQGVSQGVIIILMPFALGGVLYLINPQHIRLMLTTPIGWIMILMMLGLQIAGGFAIKKIITIKI